LSGDLFARLPQPSATLALMQIAAKAYGAPSAAHVVPAPGTQMLLPVVAALARPGRAAILVPAYNEYARAAALAGHDVTAVREVADCAGARLAIVGNPNTPDGRILQRNLLLALADDMRTKGGVLVVDEAYMDVGPPGASVAGDVARGNLVVLRSFGKFFGLAGVRLGFAIAAEDLAARLRAILGPWAVSGPAQAIGTAALADHAWADNARRRLARAASRLDAVLTAAGVEVVGGTILFRLVQTPAGAALFNHLGRAGILVRAFAEYPHWLRFGLPGDRQSWRRFEAAMSTFGRRAR